MRPSAATWNVLNFRLSLSVAVVLFAVTAFAARAEFAITPMGHEVFNGPQPGGAADFNRLSALGVKTIISVDGAIPNVAAASQRGMRYVHLPVGYDGIGPMQAARLARAVRDLPKPIYVHCHHGKHRSPTAAGIALIGLDLTTPVAAVAAMRQIGTAESYAGLYRCVMDARPLTAAELEATPADFPEQVVPTGLVALMIAIDRAFDHLKECRAAGWSPTPDHPDVLPAHEAGILAQLLTEFAQHDFDIPVERLQDFRQRGREAKTLAEELAAALQANAADSDERFKKLDQNCRSCHAAYRDRTE